MKTEKLAEMAVKDPLSDVTRRERKSLLGVGIIGITIVKTGIIPTKISALGIEFSQADQRHLFFIFAAMVVYYLVAFSIFALSDYISWKVAFGAVLNEVWNSELDMQWANIKEPPILSPDEQRSTRLEKQIETMKTEAKREELLRKTGFDLKISDMHTPNFLIRISTPLSLLRAIFEFVLPIVVGGYALYLLWSRFP